MEILFISQDYQHDCKCIEALEDFYMVISRSQYPEGYNIATGAAGPHVREEISGHALKRMKEALDTLISNGFSRADLAFYLKLGNEARVDKLIQNAYEGKKFTVVQRELIEGKIFDLVEIGYVTPGDLFPYFKGFTPNELFSFIVKSEKGRRYMKALVASLISKYGIDRYAGLLEHLGMQPTRLYRAIPGSLQALVKDMGGLRNIIYENYLTPLAIRMLESSKNAHDLLIKIGWDIPTGPTYRLTSGKPSKTGIRIIEDRIFKLFGMSYEEAKVRYFNGYLGDH